MSLKAIDIQMAIHRNDEAGIRQNQQQYKPEIDRLQLGEQAQKQAERDQQRTVKLSEPAEASVRRSGSEENGAQGKRGSRKAGKREPSEAEPAEMQTAPHPFKGHFIDLSG